MDTQTAQPIDRRRDLISGQRLGVRRDRIFQIKNNSVGGEILSLFERSRVGAGHEKNAAAWADHGQFL